MKLLLDIPQQALEIDGQLNLLFGRGGKNLLAQPFAIQCQLLKLFKESLLCGPRLAHHFIHVVAQVFTILIRTRDPKVPSFEFFIGNHERFQALLLNARSIKPVLAVLKLEDFSKRIPHGAVIMQRHVLH